MTQLTSNIEDVMREISTSIRLFPVQHRKLVRPERDENNKIVEQNDMELSMLVASGMAEKIKAIYPEMKGKIEKAFRYATLSYLVGREVESTYELYMAEATAIQDYLTGGGELHEIVRTVARTFETPGGQRQG